METKFLNITHKSLDEFEVSNYQELWNKVKSEYQGLSCDVPMTFEKSIIKQEDGNEIETFTMVLSTADEDRHGDVVKQEWDLKWIKKNPVLLDSHNYDSITHIIGRLKNIRVEDNKLKAEIEFNLDNPKGLLAYNMVKGGFLTAGSVGFIPKEFDDKGVILKSELLEYSMVSVPANPRALLEKELDEVKEEIAVIEKEMTDETPIETVIETKTKLDKRVILLNQIKKEIQELNAKNILERKKRVLSALRNL